MKKLSSVVFLLAVAGLSACKQKAEEAMPAAPVQAMAASPAPQDPDAVNPAESEGATSPAPEGK